jgi:TfoX/Sxy family transcriptional regulator of competence genes
MSGMKVPKPSARSMELFREIVPDDPKVEVKAMFGNLGAFVNGNMFAGLFGDSLGVKLLEEDSRTQLSAVPGTGPYGPPDRPMGGYVALAPDWPEHLADAQAWVRCALEDVRALPPKKAKTKKTRT